MQSAVSINLVKKRDTLLDQIVRWALSVGRLLIIITEIVAFTTFLYRFTLDRTLIDLHAKIKGEQAIIESVKDREGIYRNLQDRLLSASALSEESGKNVKILNDIIEKTPANTTYDSLSINEGKITLQANFPSISAIGEMKKFLQEYPPVSSVNISTVTNQTGSKSIKLIIVATLKE